MPRLIRKGLHLITVFFIRNIWEKRVSSVFSLGWGEGVLSLFKHPVLYGSILHLLFEAFTVCSVEGGGGSINTVYEHRRCAVRYL